MQTDSAPRPRLHPLLWVAAVSVIVFSLVGVGAITGLIPVAGGKTGDPVTESVPPQTTAPPVGAPPVASSAPAPAASTPAPAAAQAPAPERRAAPAKPAPAKTARADKAVTVENNPPASLPPLSETAPAPAKPAAAPCRECGTVESVREVQQKGDGSGLGAVAGGVVGGLLGHQIGGGRGKDLATVAGAVGGAVAGHQIEKSVRKTTRYEVTVRFEDGTTQVFSQDQQPTWRSGDRVKVVNGVIAAEF